MAFRERGRVNDLKSTSAPAHLSRASGAIGNLIIVTKAPPRLDIRPCRHRDGASGNALGRVAAAGTDGERRRRDVPVLIALPGLLHLNYPLHVNCGEGSDRANVAVRLAFM